MGCALAFVSEGRVPYHTVYQKPYIGGLLAIKLAGGKLPATNNLDRFRWYLTLDAAPDMSDVWSGVASSPAMAGCMRSAVK